MESGRDRIVVGVDGSGSSIAALRYAARLSTALDVPLEAVTAWSYPPVMDPYFAADWSPERDAVDTLEVSVSQAFGDRPPPSLTTRVLPGTAARALVELSETSGMLVLGSRGRGGFVGLLLGSVSTACAHHARCPVLIVPSRWRSDRTDEGADEKDAENRGSGTTAGSDPTEGSAP